MKSLQQFLAKRKKESPRKLLHKSSDLDEKTVLYVVGKIILEEYGKRGGENAVPKRYKEKVLYIQAYQSVWANEILLEKEKLCVLLNKKLGSGVIREIRVQNR